MGSILRAPGSRGSKRRRPVGRAMRRVLLKLYIYGDPDRVRSSRRLEREAQRNIEVIWLVRGLKPDFKTIADFRRDNRLAFQRRSASSCSCAGGPPLRPRVAGGRRNPHQGGQQQEPQLHPLLRCARSSVQPTSG